MYVYAYTVWVIQRISTQRKAKISRKSKRKKSGGRDAASDTPHWSIVLTHSEMADAIFITHFVLLLTFKLCPGMINNIE